MKHSCGHKKSYVNEIGRLKKRMEFGDEKPPKNTGTR